MKLDCKNCIQNGVDPEFCEDCMFEYDFMRYQDESLDKIAELDKQRND